MTITKEDLDVLTELKKPFPEEILEKKPGPNKKVGNQWIKQNFFYIPSENLHERLDDVLGLNWSWEIKESMVVDVTKEKSKKEYVNGEMTGTTTKVVDEKQVIVFGRLYATLPGGRVVTRDACGGCDITYGTTVGDPFKIADSNAFRKACMKLGIGRYLALEGKAEIADQKGGYNKSVDNTQSPFTNKQQSNNNSNNNSGNPFLR